MNDDCGSPASEVIKACKLLPHCEHAASVPASADGKKRGSPMDEFESWVSAIATGAATMSQRNFKWVEANGGIDQLVAIATLQGCSFGQTYRRQRQQPAGCQPKSLRYPLLVRLKRLSSERDMTRHDRTTDVAQPGSIVSSPK